MPQGSARIFPTTRRGELREDTLASFRIGARKLINPRTGQPYSDAEIAAATAKGAPKYLDADAIDLVLQLEQSRGLYLADQVRQDRASTEWLKNHHDPMWGLDYLPATGGAGKVLAPCATGTTYPGSTTLGAPTAAQLNDNEGRTYQVISTATASGSSVLLDVMAIDVGEQTNLAPGAILRWSANAPLGTEPEATVSSQFRGGLEAETDAQHVRRLQRRSRHKAGSGNRAELTAWAEAYSNAIDVAFAYSCFLYNGTGSIVPVGKRASNVRGPAGRIPSDVLMAELTAYMVPPGSPIVPDLGLLLLAPPTAVPCHLVLSLAMPTGSDAGWADYQPWPVQAGGVGVTISSLPSATVIRFACSTALPLGVTAPKLMAWDVATSSFEQLNVTGVSEFAPGVFNVSLASAPAMALAPGVMISPYTELASTIADTVQTYFDDLGPGEVIDVSSTSTDPRRARAWRFVPPNEEYPYRAGAGIVSYLQDALLGSFVDGRPESVSQAFPPIPSDPAIGPGLLVAGKVMISPL